MIRIIIFISILFTTSCITNKNLVRFLPITTSFNDKKLKFGEDLEFYILDSNNQIIFNKFEYAYNGIFLPDAFNFSEINYYGFVLKNYSKYDNYLFIAEVNYELCFKSHDLKFNESSKEEYKNLRNSSDYEIMGVNSFNINENYLECKMTSSGKNPDGKVSDRFFCSFKLKFIKKD